MKMKYLKPVLEISLLTAEDILDTSPGADVENEIFMNGDSLFAN